MVLREDTHLMSLSKEGFNIIMSHYKDNILKAQLDFFKNFSFFCNLNDTTLMRYMIYNNYINASFKLDCCIIPKSKNL
jgi:hypothetical protein